ncbi:hypothetical protein LINPERHAP2_LOCUS25775 [Linum perenne]
MAAADLRTAYGGGFEFDDDSDWRARRTAVVHVAEVQTGGTRSAVPDDRSTAAASMDKVSGFLFARVLVIVFVSGNMKLVEEEDEE